MSFFPKTSLSLLAALALTIGAAAAQTAPDPARQGQHAMPSPQQMAQHETKRLTKELNLSADQAAKVQQLMEQRAQQRQAMRANAQPGADRQQMRQQMEADRAKYDDQLKAVLTPEQFSKYTTQREAHRPGGMRPGDGRRGKFNAQSQAAQN